MTFSSSTRRPSSPKLFVPWHQEIANERASERAGMGEMVEREAAKKLEERFPATKVSHKGGQIILRQKTTRRLLRFACTVS